MQGKTHHLADNTQVMGYFLQLQTSEGRLALNRGFLHEVNNALAGIGTLAEVLKGADAAVSGPNLDLIINASRKASILQQRIRGLYSENEAIEINLADFFAGNRDLMELTLLHSPRIVFEVAEGEKTIIAKMQNLWRLVSLLLMWASATGAAKASFNLDEQGVLKLELVEMEEIKPLDELWAPALEQAARDLGAEAFVNAKKVIVVFS